MLVDHSKHLGLSDQHIVGAQERIAQQHHLISTLTKNGHETACAKHFLECLEQTLRSFEMHRTLIVQEVARQAASEQSDSSARELIANSS